jgi:hemerythrin-like metal-binding protein
LTQINLGPRRILIEIMARARAPALASRAKIGGNAMPLLEWRDEYELGIRQVDHEHIALVGVINLLGDRLDARFGDAEVRQTLHEIQLLIATHFAEEERIMRAMRYDQYFQHKADHDRLLDEIREIAREFVERPGEARTALGERVGRWFGRHFEGHDARLHALADAPVALRE